MVVAGAGFGGLNLVRKLDSRLFQVVLLDRFNYHTFQPLLYQVATAGLEPDSVAGPVRKIFRKKKNFHFRMVTVRKVNPEQKIVETSAGAVSYDYLVLATGSVTNYFGNHSVASNSFPLKQITHALDLRSRILQQFEKLTLSDRQAIAEPVLSFVVVGAGPTGVEICGALAELRRHILPKDYPDLDTGRMKITLVEGLERVLPAMSEKSGRKARSYLEEMGVEVILESLTESYDGETVRLSNGKELKSHTLIWAAGVKANRADDLPTGRKSGKLQVDRNNRVFRDPESGALLEGVFAIGDVALMKTDETPKGHPGLAPVAIQQGKHLAGNLSRLQRDRPMKPFAYKDRGVMATIGRNKAVADLPKGIWISGITGWLAWMFVHLLFMVGFRNKTVILTNWIWNYFTYDRGIRLILRPSSKERDPVSEEMRAGMTERAARKT